MSSNGTDSQLPNPFTPMSFFPPSLAFSITVSAYVMVGTLSVMIWDLLNSIGDDYTLLFQRRINFPTIIYFFSRLITLGYLISQALFQTWPLGNCRQIWKYFSILPAIVLSANSLLFFLRLRAVYRGNRMVIAFFFLLWLCVCGGNSLVIFGTSGENIGPTNYCINGGIKRYVSYGGIGLVANDTLVFFAISWRLMGVTKGNGKNFGEVLKTMILGKDLPAFSRAFLKDGQIYYLITIGFGVLTTAVVYIDTIPLVYRGIFGNPNIMVMNVLACRVYRKTRLGVYQGGPNTVASNAAHNLKYISANDNSREFGLPVVQPPSERPRSEISEGRRSFWVEDSWQEDRLSRSRSMNQGDTIPLTVL